LNVQANLLIIPIIGIGSGSLCPNHIGANSTEGLPLKKHKLMFILEIINVLQWAASEVLPSHNL